MEMRDGVEVDRAKYNMILDGTLHIHRWINF